MLFVRMIRDITVEHWSIRLEKGAIYSGNLDGQSLVMTKRHIANVPCVCEPKSSISICVLDQNIRASIHKGFRMIQIIFSLISSSHSSVVFVYLLGHSTI
jgi:hypothetical protein